MHHHLRPWVFTLAAALRTLSAGAQTPKCPADLDGDGSVTNGDVALMLLDFGDCPGCTADFDGDGAVTGGDVALALLDFGPCPECPPSGEVLQELDRVPFGGSPSSGFEIFWGWQLFLVVADGECGSYQTTRYEWRPWGTLIGSDSNYDYYSNGAGGFYTADCG